MQIAASLLTKEGEDVDHLRAKCLYACLLAYMNRQSLGECIDARADDGGESLDSLQMSCKKLGCEYILREELLQYVRTVLKV
jgi:hypothetical protein